MQETKETTKLRNEVRDAHERAVMEAGKTPFGNSIVDKSKKLSKDGSVDKANKDFFILSLDGGGLRFDQEVSIYCCMRSDKICVVPWQRNHVDYSVDTVGGNISRPDG